MSIQLTYSSLLVINGHFDNYADIIENEKDLESLKEEVNKYFLKVNEILKGKLAFSIPRTYDLEEFEKGITIFNEEVDNYGLAKLKDRIFSEIEKCWDGKELNHYDGKFAEGLRRCDIEEGDTEYDSPITISDDWSWIGIYFETDELLDGLSSRKLLQDVLEEDLKKYTPKISFQVRDYENNFSEVY